MYNNSIINCSPLPSDNFRHSLINICYSNAIFYKCNYLITMQNCLSRINVKQKIRISRFSSRRAGLRFKDPWPIRLYWEMAPQIPDSNSTIGWNCSWWGSGTLSWLNEHEHEHDKDRKALMWHSLPRIQSHRTFMWWDEMEPCTGSRGLFLTNTDGFNDLSVCYSVCKQKKILECQLSVTSPWI